jgi:hypothetical protein
MYRTTHDEHVLRRATDTAEHMYASWKQQPPPELIENAAVARTMWLLADVKSPDGERFWTRMDRPHN